MYVAFTEPKAEITISNVLTDIIVSIDYTF
jgi:hypothetical protein